MASRGCGQATICKLYFGTLCPCRINPLLPTFLDRALIGPGTESNHYRSGRITSLRGDELFEPGGACRDLAIVVPLGKDAVQWLVSRSTSPVRHGWPSYHLIPTCYWAQPISACS